MSIKAATYHRVSCDFPKCTEEVEWDGAAWLFSTREEAQEQVSEEDWLTSPDLSQHFCDGGIHFTVEPGDYDSPEEYPEPPYLLIDPDLRRTATLVTEARS